MCVRVCAGAGVCACMCVTYTYLARMNVCACRHTHTYLKRVCIHRLTIRNRHSDGAALEAGPANAQGGVVEVGPSV